MDTLMESEAASDVEEENKKKFMIVDHSHEEVNDSLPFCRRFMIVVYSAKEEPQPGDTEDGEWCLVSSHGNVHRLPKTMIFLGREECDIEIQSHDVDKRHAVITFDHYLRRFKIKDLSTVNGTYVNNNRIPEQEYVILDEQDSVYLGHDHSIAFKMERLEEGHSHQCTVQEGETIFTEIEDELPPWANTSNGSQDLQSPMAECQGCIVEQRIEHTCGESVPETKSAHQDLDRSYSHDSIATFGLGCNTWPKKRYKQKAKTSVREIFDEERSYHHMEGLIDPAPSRILRGTGAPMNKLPDELATVKKGTPLYGQPEWWGEEADLNEKLRSSSSSMDQQSSKSADTSPVEPRTNVSDSAKPSSHNGVTPHTNTVPNTDNSAVPTSKARTPEGVTNMAFTVDFGDDSKPHLDGKNIQDFVPSRLRKSFRERQEKSSEKSLSSSKSGSKEKINQEKTGSHASKPVSRAVSEGRDISPTREQKLNELWESQGMHDTAAAKRQRMQSKSSSSRSMEDENQDSVTKSSSQVKRRAPTSGNQSKPKSVIRARKAVSQEILASSAQYTSDKTSYLIDKMFQNNSTGSVDSLRAKGTGSSNSLQGKGTGSSITELDMYHEAIKYSTETASKDISTSAKLEKEKRDKKVRSKEVPVSILRKSREDSPQKEEDKASDAGTYTIEEEKDSKEEDEARKNIDKVFGVDQISLASTENLSDDLKNKLSKKPDKQGELTLNLKNLDRELEEIEKLEKIRAKPHMADSMEAELGSAESREYSDENPSVPIDAPKWVTQWAALTNQKSQNKSDMDLSSPGSSVSDDSKSSGRVPNGLSRKRPGTGRKLPTVPPGATSPTSSERSLTKESPKSSQADLMVKGTASTLQNTPQRAVKISSHVSARYEDTDSESVSLTKYGSDLSARDPDTVQDISYREQHSSNGSVASLDTEVLLKDTRTVMTAMEQRMGSKPKDSQERVPKNQYDKRDYVNEKHGWVNDEKPQQGWLNEEGCFSRKKSYEVKSDSKKKEECLIIDDNEDFESDTSSVVALVNGDEDFVKPTYYKSPREVLGKGKLKAESLPSKFSVNMSGAKTKTAGREKDIKESLEDMASTVSDIFSSLNGDNTVRTEDLDLDSGQFNRQGSKGKGTMSMTRPNRAFALRRARADGDEQLDSSRSSSSISTASAGFKHPRGSGSLTNLTNKSNANTPQKPRRPMSGVFADRNPPDSARSQPIDSSRSQASLGAQIVKKSRENLNSSFNRVDGGRHSLRVSRSLSIPAQQHNSPQSSSKTRKSDGTGSSTLQHSKSLRVTGVSAKERTSSVSKSGSRPSSPKSAERTAWKRRKEYDPRKAAAEGKPKQRDPKYKTDGFSRSKGVTRSASFNNAKDLKLSSYPSDSSADDYSRRSSGTSDVFDSGPVRGFVPYSSRSLLSSKVSTSSMDDEDVDRSVRSSSAQSTQVTPKSGHNRSRTLPMKASAFTPPPRQPPPLSVYKPVPRSRSSTRSSRGKLVLKTPSPTPPTSVSMSVHRRSVDSLELYQSALGHKNSDRPTSTPRVPESYDTLIVSSIYQLSLKLKTQTDKTMNKLRDSEVIENGLDTSLDDMENQSAFSEIPAYKSANQELAGVLKNLRKLEQHIKIMNRVLFPDDSCSPDTSKEKHEYMQEIERIKNELAGFQPIDTPRENEWKAEETASVESDCEELSHSEYY